MRRSFSRALAFGLALAVTPVLAACGGDEDSADVVTTETTTPPATEVTAPSLRVADVSLGKSISPDRRVTDETNDFAPGDTIYASVATEGTATRSTLAARWRFQDGQVVDESSQVISTNGPATTEFHVSMPTGFPVGNYTVEILLDGQPVGNESFEVE
jgi:hypothetical protein